MKVNRSRKTSISAGYYRIIIGHAVDETPEVALAAAVLAQAVFDAVETCEDMVDQNKHRQESLKAVRSEAREFLLGSGCALWASSMGIGHRWIREKHAELLDRLR